MKYMGWSYGQLMALPADMLGVLHEIIAEEVERSRR